MASFELERLNKKLIDFRNSREYVHGKSSLKLRSMLRHFKFITIIKKTINRRRVAKVSHPEKGNDFSYERNRIFNDLPKIVVYTSITGGYDNLMDPFIYPKNIDYVAFVDGNVRSSRWETREMPAEIEEITDDVLRNRYMKFHPYVFFGEKYDFAIYLDGNITSVGDLTPMVYAVNDETGLALHRHRQRDSLYAEAKVCEWLGKGDKEKLRSQVKQYKLEGFPDDFGLYECNVIVSDLKSKIGENILEAWWEEFLRSQSKRDQIALPYVIWKNGFSFDKIGSLGDNVYRNPKILIAEKTHNDEKVEID